MMDRSKWDTPGSRVLIIRRLLLESLFTASAQMECSFQKQVCLPLRLFERGAYMLRRLQRSERPGDRKSEFAERYDIVLFHGCVRSDLRHRLDRVGRV